MVWVMAQAISEPNLHPYNTPNMPQPSSFYTQLPAYEDGIKTLSRNVGKELTTIRCVISQKNVVLIGYFRELFELPLKSFQYYIRPPTLTCLPVKPYPTV